MDYCSNFFVPFGDTFRFPSSINCLYELLPDYFVMVVLSGICIVFIALKVYSLKFIHIIFTNSHINFMIQ